MLLNVRRSQKDRKEPRRGPVRGETKGEKIHQKARRVKKVAIRAKKIKSL